VNYVPAHFVIATPSATEENLLWVYKSTKGRFAFVAHALPLMDVYIYDTDSYAFEDPQEAILYELRWG